MEEQINLLAKSQYNTVQQLYCTFFICIIV